MKGSLSQVGRVLFLELSQLTVHNSLEYVSHHDWLQHIHTRTCIHKDRPKNNFLRFYLRAMTSIKVAKPKQTPEVVLG
jgi:hypothetical protein